MKARPLSRRLALLASLAGLAPLAGCGGLIPAPPERRLYRLSPTLTRSDRLPQVGVQLLIATPSAPAGIDTKRIALIRSEVSFDYFADAEWVDRPPFLVKAAIIEAFEKSRSFAGVSSEGLGLNGDFVLNTDIRDFTAVYDSPNAPPRTKVRLDVELVRMRGRDIVAETSMSREARAREARAAGNDLPAIVVAFNEAVGGLVNELVTWTATNPGLSQPQASVRSRSDTFRSRTPVERRR
jgi:cholesterol transport system auxiliary component